MKKLVENIKYIFGGLAFWELALMFYLQGLLERQAISVKTFILVFAADAVALFVCLWQAGAFERKVEK